MEGICKDGKVELAERPDHYEKNMEHIRRGNPPELQAKLDAMRGTARAKLEELRQSKTPEAKDEGHSRGH